MKTFTIEELENIFEIGRHMQYMIDFGNIKVEDGKDTFMFALGLAVEFEKEHPDSEDYYNDLDDFVIDKILKEFKNGESK